jgi:hypothetical protein
MKPAAGSRRLAVHIVHANRAQNAASCSDCVESHPLPADTAWRPAMHIVRASRGGEHGVIHPRFEATFTAGRRLPAAS